MQELLFAATNGHQVLVDRQSELVSFESESGVIIAQLDCASGKVAIFSAGDMEIRAGGKLKLRGDEGVEIVGGGDVRLVSSEETIIRGKMVRIN